MESVTSNADADEVGLGRNKQINPVGPVTSDADADEMGLGSNALQELEQ